jgi:smad nuclear-interacting protein 1
MTACAAATTLTCAILCLFVVLIPEEWAADEPPPPGPPKQEPNMGLSGKLAAETNKTADGSAELKFQAPAEARVCKKPVWKLFVYKGADTTGEPINLTQMPFYLFGKDRKVADIPTDHPSCSRQHAVIVFRWGGVGIAGWQEQR